MPIEAKLLEQLKVKFGDQLSLSPAIRREHATELSRYEPLPPDAVIFAESKADIDFVVDACAESGTPLIPYGTGTSMEGHIHAVNGGLTLDMSRMNTILDVSTDNCYAIVEPGVTREQLNSHLRDQGLFFPVDPGANASLGGMASTAASGTTTVRYGTMLDNVISLEVVTADGRTIKTRSRAKKSSAGYNMTQLFVGAEGTLGVLSSLTVKLYGIPETVMAAVCGFDELELAVQSVIETVQMGIPVARIELVDSDGIKALNHGSNLNLPEKPHLFLEFHGTKNSVVEQVQITEEIMSGNGGSDFAKAEQEEDRNRLWKARHEAALAITAYATGTNQWWTDTCVPIAKLTETILETKRDAEEQGLFMPIIGHVGDGHFHAGICAKIDDAEEEQKAGDIYDRLIKRAIDADGTCTGEHGVGRSKRDYLKSELGETVELMRAIKLALDPQNIMNPGKIIPDP